MSVVKVKVKRPKAILLDILGTTTIDNWQSQTVIPWMLGVNGISKFLFDNYDTNPVVNAIDNLRRSCSRKRTYYDTEFPQVIIPNDDGTNKDLVIDAVMKYVRQNLQNTSPVKMTTSLINLYVLVWTHGFSTGAFKGHLFSDVPAALRNWKREEIAIYSFSGFLMEIQQLLFSYSTYGNVAQFMVGFLSTNDYGVKTDPKSFEKACRRINVGFSQVLFITDNEEESKAALKTGLKTVVIERNKDVASEGNIKTLLDLDFN